MSDWLAGFGGNQGGYTPRPRPPGQREPERAPLPTPPKGGSGVVSNRQWTPGQARASAEVACCPKCGALRVKIRTPIGDTTVLMECRDCRHRWKDQRCDRIA
jgi:hypothetical protein